MKRKAEPDAEEMTSSKGPSTSKKLAPEADNDFINETELQKSIQVSVLKNADDITEEFQKNGDQVRFDPDVIAHVSALVWDTVSGDWTSDLLAFSSHARRENVNISDVALIMRRNPSLLEMVSKTADVDLSEGPVVKRRRSNNKESSRGGRSFKARRGRPVGVLTTRNGSVELDANSNTNDSPQVSSLRN
ncbi:hypothetical protein KIN20_032191 [Parelaphostrongylus tenuis]|uniref:Centromere protein S n=1 Tax=Parelaphostrongylus tenuis TaxID=148309 RepID=A0AAD5WIB6_PARTN|nr:hypothetical protein KIN20_032191 [Parelaphostrongylus tenuis]